MPYKRLKCGEEYLYTFSGKMPYNAVITPLYGFFIIPRNYSKIEELADMSYGEVDFGKALEALKSGSVVLRKGWNGKGIYLLLQKPDEHSKMTLPYIYIETSYLDTDNQYATKGRVPWLASQTDLLAEDWVIIERNYFVDGEVTFETIKP